MTVVPSVVEWNKGGGYHEAGRRERRALRSSFRGRGGVGIEGMEGGTVENKKVVAASAGGDDCVGGGDM